MNILLGPLLYIMPELDAFYCFNVLIAECCPNYVSKNLRGVHEGCSIIERLLKELDPELYSHLHLKVHPQIFAFPVVMTLMASLKPLSEVIKIWDALFSLGVHFNVIMYVSHIILMRSILLTENSSYK